MSGWGHYTKKCLSTLEQYLFLYVHVLAVSTCARQTDIQMNFSSFLCNIFTTVSISIFLFHFITSLCVSDGTSHYFTHAILFNHRERGDTTPGACGELTHHSWHETHLQQQQQHEQKIYLCFLFYVFFSSLVQSSRVEWMNLLLHHPVRIPHALNHQPSPDLPTPQR